MKKISLIIVLCALCFTAFSQPYYQQSTETGIDGADLFFKVYVSEDPIRNNYEYFHLKMTDTTKINFTALKYGKYNALGYAVVGLDSTGRVFITKLSQLPFLTNSSSVNPANISQTSFYRFATDLEKSTWNAKLSSEVDGSITNEIELPTQTGNSGRTLITNGTNPSWGKRQETYTGTTAGSGTYTVTYATAYSVTPNVQFNVNGGTTTNTARLTSSSTTGFTITANNRVEVLGLLPTYPTLNGLVIDILVTEK